MSSLCQVRADTNLGIEKFYFSIFVPLFEIVLRSGCCGGGALFNPILTGYKSTPRLSIGKRARAYCLPVVRARAAPTRCTKAVQRAVSVLPASRQSACRVRVALPVSQSVRCAYALPPVRAPRPRPAACQGIPSAPTWDKMLLCGKICHKNGNLGNEKSQKLS